MLVRGRWWWVAWALGMSACGTSSGPGSETSGGGRGGAGGAGGAPPLSLGGSAGAIGLAGSGPAGGSSGGNGGGFTWSTEDFAPVPPGTACELGHSVMEGEVAGKAFSNGYVAYPQLKEWSSWWYSWLAPHGKTQVFTKAPVTPGYFDVRSTLVAGMSYPVRGWLSLDSEGPDPNAVYCLNEGSTLTPAAKIERTQALDLNLKFSKLGSCPGTPVAGNFSFCYGPTADASCPKGVTGELEGIPLTTTRDSVESMSLVAATTENVSLFLFGDRWVRMRFPTAGGPLESGLLLTAEASFELANVYCLDAGNVTSFGPGSYKVEVTSLSKLGSCTDAPQIGTAHVCTVYTN